MNKKMFTVLFTIISTIVNILLTLCVIVLLIILSTLVMGRILGLEDPNVYTVVWMLSFLGGMVLGMFLFVRLTGWVIKKFNLEKKLDPKIVGKYVPGTSHKFSTKTTEEEKPKTVLPQSVLPKEDTWGQEDYAYAAQAQHVFPLNPGENETSENTAATGSVIPDKFDSSAPFSAADRLEAEAVRENKSAATEEEMDSANAIAAQNLFPLHTDNE